VPAFFVHGVPNTHQLWDPVRAHLTRTDIIAPDMPGFACDIPAGFRCTKEEYADWLTAEIEKAGEPVDLVGHDWGAILVQRVASLRPDSIRTWASGAAVIDLEYTWHDVARLWQTPTVGEQVMLGMTPDTMKGALAGAGVPAELAAATAEQVDDRMKDAILKLYRSATNLGADWQAELDNAREPALILWGADDPYVAARFADRLAQRVGGRAVVYENCGHWWPQERPQEAAAALEAFWAAA
jgi:pimeloyl-ACP methyl ester carboxylesterase